MRDLAPLARERPRARQREHRVRWIADIRLDHGRVDPGGATPKARLALSLLDHNASNLLDHRRAEPAHQFADRRFVGHAPVDRDQTEAPQMQRV